MLNQFRDNWNRVPLPQRAALIAILTVVFGGILYVALVSGRPSYSVLFSNLSPEDAGAVANRLREQKVEFRTTGEGKAIEVPTDKVYDLRNDLASEGIPRSGNVGFELFDKSTLGSTDFREHINYKRALEGELSRTIQGIDGVVEARVHLAMPDRPIFSEEKEPVKASVKLKLRPGYRLTEKQVAGIVHLVASGVERLLPENVTVLDSFSNPLSSGGDLGDQSDDQTERQAKYERRLTTELQGLADRVLGEGKAAIRVSAEMDWSVTQSTSESFKPGGDRGANLPIEEKTVNEKYNRAQSGPTTPGTVTNAVTAGASGTNGDYLNSRIDRRYAVNKTVEKRNNAPGGVKRLSVAVLLDTQLDAAKQLSLKNALAAGAGLDLTPTSTGGRGDKIELLAIPFDKSAEQLAAKEAETASKQALQTTMIRNGAAIFVVLLVAGFTMLMLRKPKPEPVREALDATIGEAGDAPALEAGEGGIAAVEGGEPGAEGADTSTDENATPESEETLYDENGDPIEGIPLTEEFLDGLTRDDDPNTSLGRIRRIAASQPEEVAMMLQDWLKEDAESLVGSR